MDMLDLDFVDWDSAYSKRKSALLVCCGGESVVFGSENRRLSELET